MFQYVPGVNNNKGGVCIFGLHREMAFLCLHLLGRWDFDLPGGMFSLLSFFASFSHFQTLARYPMATRTNCTFSKQQHEICQI